MLVTFGSRSYSKAFLLAGGSHFLLCFPSSDKATFLSFLYPGEGIGVPKSKMGFYQS